MQESLLRKKIGEQRNEKTVVYNERDLLTVLALERTILAKQRTILAEISVMLGTIGLGLLVFRFYNLAIIRATGLIVGISAFFVIIYLYMVYMRFKRRMEKMDKKNHILD